MSDTRDSISSGDPNTEKRVENIRMFDMSSQNLCLLRPGIQTSFTVAMFFVLT